MTSGELRRPKLTLDRTKYIKDGAGLPVPGRRGGGPAKVTNKSKFLSQNNRSLANDTTRSMPSSPALSGAGSPSLGSTSVPLSQQQAELAKAARKPLVHLLALSPMTERDLREKITSASNDDLKAVLHKVADLNETTGKYELRKSFYKELDVWTYKYDTTEDRQRAIDNAVKQYDKMRLGTSEPEWDRLLLRAERGTGKCLSKLQAQIAQGSAQRAPKINVQKAEGHETLAGGEDEDLFEDKNLKGEGMTRSVSQPPTTKKPKKVSEKEAQAKRMLSKNTTKPAPKPAAAKKEKPPKSGNRILSSQFVSDSDEEEDNYLVPAKPAPKRSGKRSREDDGETSDSSIPLSKKVKKDAPNHRVSDASQSSRTTNSSTPSSSSNKTKGNSPQKSSPLASSPPTNASEFENSSDRTSSSASPAHHTPSSGTKNTHSPIHKRHQKSSSVASSVSSTGSQRRLRPEVVDLARRYRSFYPKYEALHKEVANLEGKNRRDIEKEDELLEMHERLTKMKKDIMAGIIEAN
jgi:RNA polymerase II elongation factor ELL